MGFLFLLINSTNSARRPLFKYFNYFPVLSSLIVIFTPEFRKDSSLSLADRISKLKFMLLKTFAEGVIFISVPVSLDFPTGFNFDLGNPSL